LSTLWSQCIKSFSVPEALSSVSQSAKCALVENQAFVLYQKFHLYLVFLHLVGKEEPNAHPVTHISTESYLDPVLMRNLNNRPSLAPILRWQTPICTGLLQILMWPHSIQPSGTTPGRSKVQTKAPASYPYYFTPTACVSSIRVTLTTTEG
jgi:hypothetical protein